MNLKIKQMKAKLNSNKIFVVNNGEISDEGTHEQLLHKSSIYNNFYEKQIRKD